MTAVSEPISTLPDVASGEHEPTVITGIGVVAPNGIGVDAWWQATLAGQSAIGPITRFDGSRYPAQLAGEINGFDEAGLVPARLLPQTDPMTRLGLAAADEAMTDAGLQPEHSETLDIGVVTSASGGGIDFGQRELANMWRHGRRHVSAYQSFAWFYAVNTGQISIKHGLRGPSAVVVSDQAGGLDALGHARRALRREACAILAGGADGALCPWGWLAQLATGRVSNISDPATAYRPFGQDPTGYVPAEGAAMFVLEPASLARKRGARNAYGWLAGYAATFDSPADRAGLGLAAAISRAVADARVNPDDIDLVLADGLGTPEADRAEAWALHQVFGTDCPPISVPKTFTGRALAATAAIDVAAGLLAIRDQVAPPTRWLQPDASLELDIVLGRPRTMAIGTVLVLGRGVGGFNSAVVLRRASTDIASVALTPTPDEERETQ